jgi:hypothetical protein
VAEREKGADGDGPLAGGDEAARGEVDGGDVVCVEGVSEAEGAGVWFVVSVLYRIRYLSYAVSRGRRGCVGG